MPSCPSPIAGSAPLFLALLLLFLLLLLLLGSTALCCSREACLVTDNLCTELELELELELGRSVLRLLRRARALLAECLLLESRLRTLSMWAPSMSPRLLVLVVVLAAVAEAEAETRMP